MVSLEMLSRRALRQHLDQTGFTWEDDLETPAAQWLRGAIRRDAGRILSLLRLPVFLELHQKIPHVSSPAPDLDLDAPQTLFVKLALVLATQRLVPLPEYGPVWNGIQGQRREARKQAELLIRAGRSEEAYKILSQLPKPITREAIVQKRKRKDEEQAHGQPLPPMVTPANEPAQGSAGGSVRP